MVIDRIKVANANMILEVGIDSMNFIETATNNLMDVRSWNEDAAGRRFRAMVFLILLR